MHLPDPDTKKGEILGIAARSIHLYGHSDARGLCNDMWDIIRVCVPDLDEDADAEDLGVAMGTLDR